MELIDGKKLAERIKDQVVREVLEVNGLESATEVSEDHEAAKVLAGERVISRPNLAIVLVGERPDSKLYVNLKEKQARAVGIDTHMYHLPEAVSEAELLSTLEFLNQDDLIDAILLQLPLPGHLDADRAVAAIDPAKDADGFHPENLKKLLASCGNDFEPPLVMVILEILQSIDFALLGKTAAVVVNSEFFGKVLAHVLDCHGAKVEVVLAEEFTPERTREAELLVTAVGQPGLITADAVRQDAVIIDIGISAGPNGKVAGDVDAVSVKDKAAYLTPVPGGVGPLTIAEAFKNTVKLWRANKKKREEKI